MTACRQCGSSVESARECYVEPVCYACLPPPEPLPIRKISVREACRRRMSLDGTDAQALEHGLTQLEQENKSLREAVAAERQEVELKSACIAGMCTENKILREALKAADSLASEARDAVIDQKDSVKLDEAIEAYKKLRGV